METDFSYIDENYKKIAYNVQEALLNTEIPMNILILWRLRRLLILKPLIMQ